MCNKRHLKIISPESKTDNQFENKKPISKESKVTNDKTLGNKTQMKNILLQTLIVKLRNDKKEILSRIILIARSMCSYVT